jgi:chitin synthase
VALAETLRTVGTGLLVFVILPSLDVVKGAMLTNCLCLIPGLLAVFSLQAETNGKPGPAYYVRQGINGLAVLFQVTGFIIWPALYYNRMPHSLLLPLSLLLISCGWWENFITTTKIQAMQKFLRELKDSRYYTLLFVSLWKIACFFLIMLLATYINYESADSVGNLFSMFGASFSQRDISVTEVQTEAVTGQANTPHSVQAISSSALWVLLIHALASYICYITGKFACRILIQGIGFALPVTVTVPVVVSLLITFCGLRQGDPCYFRGTIPDYLFFLSPDFNERERWFSTGHVWVWLFWLLSQGWISQHIWKPNVNRLMSTEILFSMPGYESLFVDQSLALNRRHDKGRGTSIEDIEDGYEERFELDFLSLEEMEPGSEIVKDSDHTRRVFACATMWHETPAEMKTMLRSVFRMDRDQASRRLAQKYLEIVDPDYYEFETHIFFDDAFELSEDNKDEVVVNKFVRDLMGTIDQAASDVHGTDCFIRPPVKYPTPYGGRLVWALPGKTHMIVHLKDKDKIRHKKRWSQVMYMYYLLGHRLMELPFHINRKAVIARNTFILALDGDIDFKPDALILLLDLMKKDTKLGAACGRIHPTGKGPMVWYQKFEYAIGHWLQKATEHVIGCVLCSPGCFSLFRGEALMDDAVMNKYTTVSKKARHFVQYDQGEDRWLCTLLLQRGYRVEYSAASDAYTQSPETFDEFYNQRRRWVPSTMANIMDLLSNSKQTVKINNNISYLYIVYQGALFLGSILGPGSIFLMLVGAFVAAFRIDNWTSFLYNIVPILVYMFVCYFCKERIQLTVAKIISALYGLVMMAVLVGIMLQIMEDGPLAPSSLFFFIVAGTMIIAAFLHPQELGCLIAGVVYYVTVPSMYLLLIVYAIFNLYNVSWGTREAPAKKSKKELEQEKKEAEEAKKEAKKKSFWGFLRREKQNKEEEEGSIEFSMAGLCQCMLCTRPKSGEDKLHLVAIEDSLDKLNRRLDNMEKVGDPASRIQPRRRSTARTSQQILGTVPEDEEIDSDEDTDSLTDNECEEPKCVRDDEVSPYWIDQPEMKRGNVEFLPSKELQFWKDLIDKYLHPLNKDAKIQKENERKLKDLRDLAVFAFFMLNALFVLVIFLLQLSRDVLYFRWPFGVKVNITVVDDEIIVSKEYLQLEPIGVVFILVFGIILITQFIAMLFHRFGTLSHMLAKTRFSIDKSEEKHTEAKIAVQVTKHLQELRGINGDSVKEEIVGRRRTVHNIHKNHHLHRKKPMVTSLDAAFKRRLTMLKGDSDLDPKVSLLHRDSVNRMVNTARKSVIHERMIRRESKMVVMNNMRPEDTHSISQV